MHSAEQVHSRLPQQLAWSSTTQSEGHRASAAQPAAAAGSWSKTAAGLEGGRRTGCQSRFKGSCASGAQPAAAAASSLLVRNGGRDAPAGRLWSMALRCTNGGRPRRQLTQHIPHHADSEAAAAAAAAPKAKRLLIFPSPSLAHLHVHCVDEGLPSMVAPAQHPLSLVPQPPGCFSPP